MDDQMIEAGKDNRIVNLFTKGSHHRNLSVIYIVQNLLHQGKGNRSISLNSHYLVLFKNPRDKLQLLTLAKQMYPSETAWFIKESKRRCEDHMDIFLYISSQRFQIDVDCEQMFYPGKKDSTNDSKRIEFPKNCSNTSNKKTLMASPPISEMQRIQNNMDNIFSTVILASHSSCSLSPLSVAMRSSQFPIGSFYLF